MAWKGEYMRNKRVAMGCCFASSIGQRTSFGILKGVDVELDHTLAAELFLHEGEPWMEAVRAWRVERMGVFPEQPAQWRPW
jgi:hypothetical protein